MRSRRSKSRWPRDGLGSLRNLELLLAWRQRRTRPFTCWEFVNRREGETRKRRTPGRASLPDPVSRRALLARLRLFYDTGRCADAEQLIVDAANDPRNDPSDLRNARRRFLANSAGLMKPSG